MTATWNPCDEGRRLYNQWKDAADLCSDASGEIDLDTYLTLHGSAGLAFWLWESHRDSCERCKIAKETK